MQNVIKTRALWFQKLHVKLSELSLISSFCQKHIFQLENSRGTMCHDADE